MVKDEVWNSREKVRDKKKIVKIKRSKNGLRKGPGRRWMGFVLAIKLNKMSYGWIKYRIVPIHNKILTLFELFLCKKIVKSDAIPIKMGSKVCKKYRDVFKIFTIENT